MFCKTHFLSENNSLSNYILFSESEKKNWDTTIFYKYVNPCASPIECDCSGSKLDTLTIVSACQIDLSMYCAQSNLTIYNHKKSMLLLTEFTCSACGKIWLHLSGKQTFIVFAKSPGLKGNLTQTSGLLCREMGPLLTPTFTVADIACIDEALCHFCLWSFGDHTTKYTIQLLRPP